MVTTTRGVSIKAKEEESQFFIYIIQWVEPPLGILSWKIFIESLEYMNLGKKKFKLRCFEHIEHIFLLKPMSEAFQRNLGEIIRTRNG